jgi:putative DNA modification/repair radical SAM protein
MKGSNFDYDFKIAILGDGARFDLCGSCFGGESRKRSPLGSWIYPVALPDGKRVNVLKILLSNRCIHNCFYCVNRVESNRYLASFTAEELVRLFVTLYNRGMVRGLFLSSAVDKDPVRTMSEMMKVVEILRYRLRFRGYIHLKILPEAGASFIEEAVRLATRVSVNLEAPTPSSLARIAPEKNFKSLWQRLEFLKSLKESQRTHFDFTTQFVVGAGGETDREIMSTTATLYKKMKLARAYYSAFQPVAGTPLADLPPASTWREHRLYQADFLLRKYGFCFEELCFDEEGNLPVAVDPKTCWAVQHPEFFPVELNTAPLETLIRVPGIGILSARKIVELRTHEPLTRPEVLKTMGIRIEKALPFVLLRGKRFTGPVQLSLFQGEASRAPVLSPAR